MRADLTTHPTLLPAATRLAVHPQRFADGGDYDDQELNELEEFLREPREEASKEILDRHALPSSQNAAHSNKIGYKHKQQTNPAHLYFLHMIWANHAQTQATDKNAELTLTRRSPHTLQIRKTPIKTGTERSRADARVFPVALINFLSAQETKLTASATATTIDKQIAGAAELRREALAQATEDNKLAAKGEKSFKAEHARCVMELSLREGLGQR